MEMAYEQIEFISQLRTASNTYIPLVKAEVAYGQAAPERPRTRQVSSLTRALSSIGSWRRLKH